MLPQHGERRIEIAKDLVVGLSAWPFEDIFRNPRMIEEVHWGLTPDEQRRVFWDISWIWGPPEDHLAKLFRTIGPGRFLYGTQWPMRLTQTPRANLDLLPDDLRGSRLADADAVCARS